MKSLIPVVITNIKHSSTPSWIHINSHNKGLLISFADTMCLNFGKKKIKEWVSWLAQSVEHVTLDLRVVSLSSTLDVEII